MKVTLEHNLVRRDFTQTMASIAALTVLVLARVSTCFGFDLPVTSPYYQSANAGQPLQNPLASLQP